MERSAQSRESRFVNGQPISVENGVQQANTTDQSASFNVAMVLLEIARIETAYAKEGSEAVQRRVKDAQLSRDNIKLSMSLGESTISQIFSRGQGTTLNCGGSATLDVAKEIAHTIFGGAAVEVQGSRLSEYRPVRRISGRA
jgi:hypothetical protein